MRVATTFPFVTLDKSTKEQMENWCRWWIQFNYFRGQLIQKFRNKPPFTRNQLTNLAKWELVHNWSTLIESRWLYIQNYILQWSNNLKSIKLLQQIQKFCRPMILFVWFVMNVHWTETEYWTNWWNKIGQREKCVTKLCFAKWEWNISFVQRANEKKQKQIQEFRDKKAPHRNVLRSRARSQNIMQNTWMNDIKKSVCCSISAFNPIECFYGCWLPFSLAFYIQARYYLIPSHRFAHTHRCTVFMCTARLGQRFSWIEAPTQQRQAQLQ